MRHRKRGRHLGRSSSHRKAMLKNLASSLFLTERDSEFDENKPKVKGRVITTLEKAKEVRPLVEKCVTIARHALPHQRDAEQFATSAERGTEAWRSWRDSDQWRQWSAARAPAVAARRRALQLLGDKQAVRVLFDVVAPRFEDRPGGYTRILRLAKPRLGDAGTQAMLEFVGQHDRVRVVSERPSFTDDERLEPASSAAEPPAAPSPEPQAGAEQPAEPASEAPETTTEGSSDD